MISRNGGPWRLQRHIARLQQVLGRAVDSTIDHYEAAFRLSRADAGLIAEYGAFLFMQAQYGESEEIFSQGRQFPGPEKK
jgi:Tfp pilus assembly protein PilF